MISAAQLVLDQAAEGKRRPQVEHVPAWQWRERFEDLCRICPSRLEVEAGRDFNRQRNALRCENVPSVEPRCSLLSPDGRGAVWFMSGGSPLAYGRCELAMCPRAKGGGK